MILDAHGRPIPSRRRTVAMKRLQARYDAAQVSKENVRHWNEADSLSARAANSPDVRKRLRDRSRYEAANNAYASGIASTMANDLIGVGPRLQFLTGNRTFNHAIESEFMNWSEATCLPEKLWTATRAWAVDGESFLIMDSRESLWTPVKLDVRSIEADQVADPYLYELPPYAVDGIRFDKTWYPKEYHILKSHPGDDMEPQMIFEYDTVPARYVMHWYRKERPQQYRGVPLLTPVLNLFAQLRRYTLAVIAGAEIAADFAAVVYSDLTPDGTPVDSEPFETLDIERGMMTTLPAGWKMQQFKPEQPTSNYQMFKSEILNEIARGLNVPFNIAAGNSSSYNYASGRLDHQTYFRTLKVNRAELESTVLNPLLDEWILEMRKVSDIIPDDIDQLPRRWLWLGMEHVDPQKEAKAQETRLRNYMTTFSDECQAQGVDPESRAQTIANDFNMFRRVGIAIPSSWSMGPQGQPGAPPDRPQPEPEDDDLEDDDIEIEDEEDDDDEDEDDISDRRKAAAAARHRRNGFRHDRSGFGR